MKIGIIGSTGVGKSTVAKKLGQVLAMPVIEEPIPSTLGAYLDSIGSRRATELKRLHQVAVLDAYTELADKCPDTVIWEVLPAVSYYVYSQEFPELEADYAAITERCPVDITFYLYADLETVYNRVNFRARPGEEAYTLEFLEDHKKTYLENLQNIVKAHNCQVFETIDTTDKPISYIVGEMLYKLARAGL